MQYISDIRPRSAPGGRGERDGAVTAARNRPDGNLSAIVRSAKTYAESVKAGKTDEEAKRDAAIAVVHNYRLEHNL